MIISSETLLNFLQGNGTGVGGVDDGGETADLEATNLHF